jgi:hypothetical protein
MGSADGRRRAMRDGRREDDAETHGNPAADVWAREVASSCRPLLAELAPPDPMGRPQATASGTVTEWRRQAPNGPSGRWVHSPNAPADVVCGERVWLVKPQAGHDAQVALGQCEPVRSTERSPGHAGDLIGEEEPVMTLLLQQNRAGFCAEHLTQADMPPSPLRDILAFLYLSAPNTRRQ